MNLSPSPRNNPDVPRNPGSHSIHVRDILVAATLFQAAISGCTKQPAKETTPPSASQSESLPVTPAATEAKPTSIASPMPNTKSDARVWYEERVRGEREAQFKKDEKLREEYEILFQSSKRIDADGEDIFLNFDDPRHKDRVNYPEVSAYYGEYESLPEHQKKWVREHLYSDKDPNKQIIARQIVDGKDSKRK